RHVDSVHREAKHATGGQPAQGSARAPRQDFEDPDLPAARRGREDRTLTTTAVCLHIYSGISAGASVSDVRTAPCWARREEIATRECRGAGTRPPRSDRLIPLKEELV